MLAIQTFFDQPHSIGISEDILAAGDGLNPEFNQYLEYYAEQLQHEGTKRVLIIEDDPFSQKILENSVHHLCPDLRCFHASSEKEVMNILKLVPCHLTISDYYLNGATTGLDICLKIKDMFPDNKCVIVSQLKTEQYNRIARTISTTTPEFIEKPITPSALNNHILNLLSEGNKHAISR